MEVEVNEEKRQKFMEYAGKRVNNVLHDMEILEPMARSNSYDFTKQDLEEMFGAMQETLNEVKTEFYKKFEAKALKANKKVFTFGASKNVNAVASVEEPVITKITEEQEVKQIINEEQELEPIIDEEELTAEFENNLE